MILEGDCEVIAHHAAQHRSKNAQPSRPHHARAKRSIGVLNVAKLIRFVIPFEFRREGFATDNVPLRGRFSEKASPWIINRFCQSWLDLVRASRPARKEMRASAKQKGGAKQ